MGAAEDDDELLLELAGLEELEATLDGAEDLEELEAWDEAEEEATGVWI